jgi:hypothetical protein
MVTNPIPANTMKSTPPSVITTFAALALLAIGQVAQAGTPATTVYNTDDLFIGFTQTGSSSDYLIDIGQASTYRDATSTIILSRGDIGADLTATFGAGWASDSTVSWGIAGTTRLSVVGSDPAHTVYASRKGTASTATAWNDAASLSTPDARMASMATAYNGKTSTNNSTYGLVQNNIAVVNNNAWASYQPGGANATGAAANTSFAFFSPTILASSANGITDTTASLAVFRLLAGSNNPGVAIGTFTINSSGTITFTPATAPSAFTAWTTAHSLTGSNALPTADPDHDGLPNMVEFVLGTDPTKGTTSNLPSAVLSGSNLTFSFPHNPDSVAEYNVAVQTSTDLVTWTTQSAGTESGGVYTKVIPTAGTAKMFARLLVTKK